MPSEQPPEFVNCHPRCTDDSAHSIGIDRIRTWNRQMALTVRQNDVFALTNNPKPGFLKCSNGFQVRDAGKFAQSL